MRFQKGLDSFRKLGLLVWKRNVRRRFWKWFGKVGKHRNEREDIWRDDMKVLKHVQRPTSARGGIGIKDHLSFSGGGIKKLHASE